MSDKWRKQLTWGKRIVLTLVILCGVIYGVLSLAEKNLDPMRMGLEDYLEKVSGANATITDMTKVELVPHVAMGMKGVLLKDKTNPDKTLAHADEVYISLPFWTLLSGSGDYYAVQAKNVQISSGFGLPKKLALRFAGISDPAPQGTPPNFMMEGDYNGLPVLVTAGMERHPGKKFYRYGFLSEYPVTFKLGETEGDGIYERRGASGVFKKVQMVHGPHRADFVLRNIGRASDDMEAEGSINGVEFTGHVGQKDGKTYFLINPLYGKKDDDKRVANFLKILNRDLGFDGGIPLFMVDLPVKVQNTEVDGKK